MPVKIMAKNNSKEQTRERIIKSAKKLFNEKLMIDFTFISRYCIGTF